MTETASKEKGSALKIIADLAAGAPVFGSLLYLIGRVYTESYYKAIGIPTSSLTFSFADYLYFGIRSWTFIIAILLTILIFIVWEFYRLDKKEAQPSNPYDGKRKRDILKDILANKKDVPKVVMLLYFVYFVMIVIPMSIWLLMTAERNSPAEILVQLTAVPMTLWTAYCIIYDSPTKQYVRYHRRIYYSFIAVTIFTIILGFQWLPSSVGSFIGMNDSSDNNTKRVFPAVQIITSKQLDATDIQWKDKGNGLYTNDKQLYLLVMAQDEVFVRSLKNKNPISIPRSSIVELQYNVQWISPK